MHRTHTLCVALLIALTAAACGDDDAPAQNSNPATNNATTSTNNATTSTNNATTSTNNTGTSTNNATTSTNNATTSTNNATTRPIPEPLAFEPCDASIPVDPGTLCGIAQVPLDWDDPEGEQIDLHTFKIPAASSPSLGSVWLLDGGPSGSGLDYATEFRREMREGLAEFDIYIPQHRGTGRSTGLDCGGAETDAVTCAATLEAQWGDRLGHFTTWAAGRDVVHLIDAVRQGGSDDAFVWGGSYGTYWALHALHHAPDQPTGVVLDSALGMDTEFWMVSADAGPTPEFIIDTCEAMPSCRANFDAPVSDVVDRALAQIDAPDCDTGSVSVELARYMLASELSTRFAPALGLAMVARLARCDQAVIAYLSGFPPLSEFVPDTLPVFPYEPDEFFNNALAYQIIRNSVFPDAERYPTEAIQARVDATRLPRFAYQTATLPLIFERWPRLDNAVRVATLPDSDVPMLIMASKMDRATPLAWNVRLAEHYAGPHQHLLTFDFAGHVVTNNSETSDGSNCGVQVLRSFVLDPLNRPDASCAQDIVFPDFTGETIAQEEIERYFGEGATLFGD